MRAQALREMAVRAAAHVGKARTRLEYNFSGITAAGGPLEQFDGDGVTLRLSRNGKSHDVTLSGVIEAVAVRDGQATFAGKVNVSCTLFEGKRGSAFAEKMFQVSLMAVKSKRVSEMARAELDLASLTSARLSLASTLELTPRGRFRGKSPVTITPSTHRRKRHPMPPPAQWATLPRRSLTLPSRRGPPPPPPKSVHALPRPAGWSGWTRVGRLAGCASSP
jgi:hypothetical protein